jgi:hypothetical protein
VLETQGWSTAGGWGYFESGSCLTVTLIGKGGVEEALPSTDASADLLLQVNRKDEFVRTRDEYLFG